VPDRRTQGLAKGPELSAMDAAHPLERPNGCGFLVAVG